MHSPFSCFSFSSACFNNAAGKCGREAFMDGRALKKKALALSPTWQNLKTLPRHIFAAIISFFLFAPTKMRPFLLQNLQRYNSHSHGSPPSLQPISLSFSNIFNYLVSIFRHYIFFPELSQEPVFKTS